MRIRTFMLAFGLGLTVMTTGCGNSFGLDGSPGEDTMTALIDGVPFAAVTISRGSGSPSTVNFVGTTSTATSPVTQISILVSGVSGSGTYVLDATSFPSALALVTVTDAGTPSQWSTTSAAGPGSATITSLTDRRVRGTFQFVADADPGTAASGQVSVTSGTFDVGR